MVEPAMTGHCASSVMTVKKLSMTHMPKSLFPVRHAQVVAESITKMAIAYAIKTIFINQLMEKRL